MSIPLVAQPEIIQDVLPPVQPTADAAKRAEVARVLNELDINDSNSILFFGSKAQKQLASVSDEMLDGVKNKDIGEAGKTLNEAVMTLKGFNIDALDPTRKKTLMERMFGSNKPVQKFAMRYQEVGKQIDAITDRLEERKTELLTDVTWLDRLYNANLDYFRLLEVYIAAAQQRLEQLDREEIPALEREINSSGDVLISQRMRDLRAARDELDRRLHDLLLTRQVTLQSLPSIRLVQENDKGLISKINSTLANTVPLWRQQLAQMITIHRSGEAAKSVKAATDLTNELLLQNARNLKIANAQVRGELERGVFDIGAVKQANQLLIETIEDSLRIADEGKRKRAEAYEVLKGCEAELRRSLEAARAREISPPSPPRIAA
jgi:uncharacterized protein YaaN involved in tellurite resistance